VEFLWKNRLCPARTAVRLTQFHLELSQIEPLFKAYLAGLIDSGWSGNEDEVRLVLLT
jgi:hypothetical protein